ncbi:MAG: WD40 repeat domain-containing serine/threonine protein kinase [Isosphaeraceae bacterium]
MPPFLPLADSNGNQDRARAQNEFRANPDPDATYELSEEGRGTARTEIMDEDRSAHSPGSSSTNAWPIGPDGEAILPDFAVADSLYGPGSPSAAGALAIVAPRGLLGHYRIVRPLGQGNMGVVFLAQDLTLDRAVAIKVLAPERALNPDARLRFIREAKSAAAIHHENVVPVYAVDQSGKLPFLVMKFVDGKSLEEKIKSEGPLAPAEVIRLGIQIASGLAAAHARGLIHRDIKPSNILLDGPSEEVRISDFGLARALDDAGITQEGTIAGTPLYMAPEQARGEAVDHRADLYSLGRVLFAACVGRPPFQGASTMAVLRRVCDESPGAVLQVRPQLPPVLSDLIAKLHARDPADRVQTAAEVASILKSVAENPKPSSAHTTEPLQFKAASAGRRKSRRRWLAAWVLLSIPAVALGFTEAAGITHVSELMTTVLNIRTPSGTLVVEVDDPGVSVLVEDGGEQLVITGTGFHEVRLRPGRHAVRTTKDGTPAVEESVTITQGGKQVVKVTQSGDLLARNDFPSSLATLRGHSQGLNAVAFRPPQGDRIATASYDRTVKIWDRSSLHVIATLGRHKDAVFGLAYSPDGKLLATCGWDRVVRLWNAQTAELVAELPGHANWVWSVAFSPDGATLASAGADLTVRFWDVAKRTERASFSTHSIARNLIYSPDGKFLVTAHDAPERRNLIVWNAATRELITVLEGHPGGAVCLAFSPDGSTLASGGYDRSAAFWNVASWTLRRRLLDHDFPVYAVAFSPDGRILAAGEGDYRHVDQPGQVKLWDVSSGHNLATLREHQGGIIGAAFSPDDKTLATASADFTAKLWNVPAKPDTKSPAR